MVGYNIFINSFYELSLEERKNFLKNIFELSDVSFYQIFFREGIIYFRIYVDDVFYQFEFLLKKNIVSSYVRVSCTKRLVLVYIYVFNYVNYNWGDTKFKLLSAVFMNASEDALKTLFNSF